MRAIFLVVLAIASPAQLMAQSILGTVVEEGRRQPVSAVSVALLDATRGTVRVVLTDENGRFVVIAPRAGRYQLRTERIGYAVAETNFVELQDNETITVEVTLPINAVTLAPITVQQRNRKPAAMLDDFYRRSRTHTGGGVFFNREQIRKRNPQRLTDLLRDVSGLQVSPANSAGGRSARVRRQGSADCALQVFVDGRQYRHFDASGIDSFAPGDLEGIEVYKGLAEVPAEFGGDGSRCGVVALWTRRGAAPARDADLPRRGTELRFLGALGAVVLLTLLAR